jgi:hypothetical protein
MGIGLMLTLRPAAERGHTAIGWLDSYHTFSFGEYQDPRHIGFRSLRVINEDRVAPGMGFGRHPHRDMEIITYVLEGTLDHSDSLGNETTARPGDVQRLSAGEGILHREWNGSNHGPVHFLQIWIIPNKLRIEPSYEQQHFPPPERQGRWRVIASPDGRDRSVTIHQDAAVYASLLNRGETVIHELAAERHAWIQIARGRVTANGQLLESGDGLAVREEPSIHVAAMESSELLLFDLP